MKMKYWALSLLACGGMLACTNDEVAENNGKEEGTEVSYLAVNVMNTVGPGSRALPTGYESGSIEENEISTMRFYLFNSDGTPYTLTGGTNCVTASYSEDTDNDQTTSTVEEVGNAVLVIEGSTATPPASVVAILNYDPGTGGTDAFAGKNLTQLKAETGNYGATGDGQFIMSNSVYNNGTTIGEVSVVGKVEKSSAAALANPVEIYVERVVAKVRVSDGRNQPATSGTYLVSGSEDNNNAIYAVVEGWQVADYNNKSFILKNITSSWTNAGLGFSSTDPWSSSDYHRSFWATSVAFDGNNSAGNNSWNNISSTLGTSVVYTQENTSTSESIDAEENNLTKVIVAATLKKKDDSGTLQPVSIYKLYGADYAGEDDILKEIAGKYTEKYYTLTAPNTYTSIDAGDLEFKTPADLGDNSIASYYVVAQVKNGNIIYKKGEGDTYIDATSECNGELKSIPVQIWNGGKTYYYTTIKHLGSTGSIAEYGVVRNHIYEVKINNIQGLGTPVYDPSEVIVPVTPGDEVSYIAARINILSWRVVSNNVTLGE